MHQTQPTFTRTLLIWSVANLVGFGTIPALYALLPGSMLAGILSGLLLALVAVSLPVGVAQWWVLRTRLGVSALWILTLTVAALLFMLLLTNLLESLLAGFDGEATWLIAGLYLIYGLIAGLLQWPFLRGRLRYAGLWIGASGLGIGLGFALALGSGLMNWSPLAAFVVVVGVYSLVTGLALAWLANAGDTTTDQTTEAALSTR